MFSFVQLSISWLCSALYKLIMFISLSADYVQLSISLLCLVLYQLIMFSSLSAYYVQLSISWLCLALHQLIFFSSLSADYVQFSISLLCSDLYQLIMFSSLSADYVQLSINWLCLVLYQLIMFSSLSADYVQLSISWLCSVLYQLIMFSSLSADYVQLSIRWLCLVLYQLIMFSSVPWETRDWWGNGCSASGETEQRTGNFCFNWEMKIVFASNSDCVILISLQPNAVDLRYFKIWILKLSLFKMSQAYTIRLERYRVYKLKIVAKIQFIQWNSPPSVPSTLPYTNNNFFFKMFFYLSFNDPILESTFLWGDKRNWACATNENFLIPISSQTVGVVLWRNKFRCLKIS